MYHRKIKSPPASYLSLLRGSESRGSCMWQMNEDVLVMKGRSAAAKCGVSWSAWSAWSAASARLTSLQPHQSPAHKYFRLNSTICHVSSCLPRLSPQQGHAAQMGFHIVSTGNLAGSQVSLFQRPGLLSQKSSTSSNLFVSRHHNNCCSLWRNPTSRHVVP